MTNQQEILFRGFNLCADGDTIIVVEGKEVIGRWIEGVPINKNRQMIVSCFEIKPLKDEDCMCLKGVIHKVIPSTVGQYIGKKDKNGVKIFTGDIILANFETPFIVEWDSEGCRFIGVQPNDGSRHFSTSDRYICYLSDTREVIGNIFDKIKENTQNEKH